MCLPALPLRLDKTPRVPAVQVQGLWGVQEPQGPLGAIRMAWHEPTSASVSPPSIKPPVQHTLHVVGSLRLVTPRVTTAHPGARPGRRCAASEGVGGGNYF